MLLGLFYLAMSLVVLFSVVPHATSVYEQAADMSLFSFYGELVRRLIVPHATFFAWMQVAYEATMGLLILGKGWRVKVGLVGFIIFLIGIFPAFGLYTVSMPAFALIPALLLLRDYDRNAIELLRLLLRRW